MQVLLISIIITTLWCVLHSIMATNKIKSYFPLNQRNYRLFYTIQSGITLGLLTVILVPLSQAPEADVEPVVQVNAEIALVLSILSIIGILFVAGSIIQTNPLKFVGLQSETEQDLRIHGFYRFSRHPMYTGAILLLGPAIFTTGNIVYVQQNLIFVFYFILGSLNEEQRLKSFLPNYEVMYKRGHLFPWKYQHFQTLFGK